MLRRSLLALATLAERVRRPGPAPAACTAAHRMFAAILALALGPGCGPRRIDVPIPATGDKTQILVVSREVAGSLTVEGVYADRIGTNRIGHVISETSKGQLHVEILLYARSIEEMMIKGTGLLAPGTGGAIPVPPDRILALDITGGQAGPAQPADALTEGALMFRSAAFTTSPDCQELGACYKGTLEDHTCCTYQPMPVEHPTAPVFDLSSLPCTPARDACPQTEFADFPTGSNVIYVKAGAPAGGTGDRAHPFDTIDGALANVAPNTTATIALSAGSHRAPAALPPGVTIAGLCPPSTTVSATSSFLFVPSGTSKSALRNLTLSTVTSSAIVVADSAKLGLAAVDLGGTVIAGSGSALSGESVVIRGARGFALRAAGAAVDLARVEIAETMGTPLFFQDVRLHAWELCIHHSASLAPSDLVGYLTDGATIIERSRFEDNQTYGLTFEGTGTATLSEVAFRRSCRPSSDSTALDVFSTARMDVSLAEFTDNACGGIVVFGGRVRMRQMRLAQAYAASTIGVVVGKGATASLDTVSIQGGFANAVQDALMWTMSMKDVDIGPNAAQLAPDNCISLTLGSTVLERLRLRGCRTGIAYQNQNDLTGTDVEIGPLDIMPGAAKVAGILVANKGRLKLDRFSIMPQVPQGYGSICLRESESSSVDLSNGTIGACDTGIWLDPDAGGGMISNIHLDATAAFGPPGP